MAFLLRGQKVPLSHLERELITTEDGVTTLAEMSRASRVFGIEAIAARVGTDALDGVPCPFIAHFSPSQGGEGHFVVVLKVTPESALYIDAPNIPRLEPRAAFAGRFSGNVLVFGRSDSELREFACQLSCMKWKRQFLIGTFSSCATALIVYTVAEVVKRRRSRTPVGRSLTHAI